MEHKSDIEIAHQAVLKPIWEIGEQISLGRSDLELFGDYKAKIKPTAGSRHAENEGKLVLVTAITPTPAGEGKSTTTIGLGMALTRKGYSTAVALREPSLGPCFGFKGGAAGGGYAQVLPMEDINLHFTGDIHAVTAAHNLLSAIIDNHLKQGNELGIDPTRIVWPRVLDMNDRALRNVVVGLGGPENGIPRQDRYVISVASEIMAILCLADDIMDLKERVAGIVVADTYNRTPIRAGDLQVAGAVAVLLKDAIKPNLVQTLENTPAFVHGGPFANIAHGCNSVTATRMGLRTADIVITEAGFGSDLGAEKFCNIKCRKAGLKPDCAVVVATVRALKLHGGVPLRNLGIENVEAVRKGLDNLDKHVENVRAFGIPAIVAVNRFPTDTESELRAITNHCEKFGVRSAVSDVWARGGEGGLDLAEQVEQVLRDEKSEFHLLYDTALPIRVKIEIIARTMYGAATVEYETKAEKQLARFEEQGFAGLPICMAKTQKSLSDKPELIGRPRNFPIRVRELSISAGAGFLVVYTGEILTMPGLPKVPAATGIDIDADGVVTGLS